MQNYQSAVEQLVSILGDEDAAANRLSQCIFTVGMGSNDYLNNYFMPDYYNTAQTYDPAAYAAALLQEYERQLTALYALGARKFVVAGVGQIGCIPYELARIDDDEAGLLLARSCTLHEQEPTLLMATIRTPGPLQETARGVPRATDAHTHVTLAEEQVFLTREAHADDVWFLDTGPATT